MGKRRKLFAVVAAATVGVSALAGCAGYKGEEIGSGASDSVLKGTTVSANIFPGAGFQNSTTISASAFSDGDDYVDHNDSALTIKGDLPANVTILVTNGTLTVNGNVAEDDSLNAQAPVVTHEVKYGCYPYGPANAYEVDGCSETKIDGLKYASPSSVLKVFGTVSSKAQLLSNSGIAVNGKPVANPGQLKLA